MQEAHLVVPDSLAKQEDSDQRRIVATLDKVGKSTKERSILDGYLKVLMVDLSNEKTTLRSIRLSLTPAAALLLKGREMRRVPPDQKVLDSYLEQTPGQRAAVSGFVCYLRDKHGADIALLKANSGKVLLNRKKKLEAEMLALMQEGGPGDEFRKRWLSVALAYFHGLPKKAVTAEVYANFKSAADSNGVILTLKEKEYWLPSIWQHGI